GWRFLGDDAAQLLNAERRQVLELLREEGALSPAQVAAELAKSRPAVRMLLKRMREDSQVTKQGSKYIPSLSVSYRVTEREGIERPIDRTRSTPVMPVTDIGKRTPVTPVTPVTRKRYDQKTACFPCSCNLPTGERTGGTYRASGRGEVWRRTGGASAMGQTCDREANRNDQRSLV